MPLTFVYGIEPSFIMRCTVAMLRLKISATSFIVKYSVILMSILDNIMSVFHFVKYFLKKNKTFLLKQICLFEKIYDI